MKNVWVVVSKVLYHLHEDRGENILQPGLKQANNDHSAAKTPNFFILNFYWFLYS